jgi:predicted dehydrogenase
LLDKALARPDLVRQVIAKAKTDGIQEAWRQSMARLDVPTPVGYSSAGTVVAVGSDVQGFSIGDRIACSGTGFSAHSDIAAVPSNLCVRIPGQLNFEAASFAALGGIALEAVRMANISIGSRVCVLGLGLLGQLTIQLLRAAGCRVVGMDPDPTKTIMAAAHGAEAVATSYQQLQLLVPVVGNFAGFDAVIIVAATPSNEPLEQAADICRERGRVVATGLIGLDLPRKPFYDKELEFVVSRAWGPGLYDTCYAEQGIDYPAPYARWTAQRNLEAFLEQLSSGRVEVAHLISHRFDFSDSLQAYNLILSGSESYLGVVLQYPHATDVRPSRINIHLPRQAHRSEEVGIGVIGAGLFAKGTLIPALCKLNQVRLCGISSLKGLNAQQIATKFGFEYCTSDTQELLRDPAIDLLAILTRHGSHAGLVSEALRAGKHVFVEKPLATTPQQLSRLVVDLQIMNGGRPVLMVGFNRRFAPCATWLKQRFAHVQGPLTIQCTVNAGPVPQDSWVYDLEDGAGRIVGEVCHFIDLIQYLTASLPASVYAQNLRSIRHQSSDNVLITLKMHNGSLASITYVSTGAKAHPRERVEVYGGGSVGVIDNFRRATYTNATSLDTYRHWFGVDRGHRNELSALVTAIRAGAETPVHFDEYVHTTLATFAIEQSLRDAAPVEINPDSLSMFI